MFHTFPFLDGCLHTNSTRNQSLVFINSQIISQNHAAHTTAYSKSLGWLDFCTNVLHWLFEIINAHGVIKFGCFQIASTLPPETNHGNIVSSFLKGILDNSLQVKTLIWANLSWKQENQISIKIFIEMSVIVYLVAYKSFSSVLKLENFLLVILEFKLLGESQVNVLVLNFCQDCLQMPSKNIREWNQRRPENMVFLLHKFYASRHHRWFILNIIEDQRVFKLQRKWVLNWLLQLRCRFLWLFIWLFINIKITFFDRRSIRNLYFRRNSVSFCSWHHCQRRSLLLC